MTDIATVIKGRNRWADHAMTKVTVRDSGGWEDILVVEGGYLETRGDGKFVLAAKHPEAVDEEGDSAYVLYMEGAGLQWKDMFGPEHRFNAVILKARWVSDEDAAAFIDEHGYLKFTPDPQKWTPDAYEIRIEHI